MYDEAVPLRGLGRVMERPSESDPVVDFQVALERVRKLLSGYLPGMSADAGRLKDALERPVNEPAQETERLFALGWLNWLQGDWAMAEELLARADRICQEPMDQARSAYWLARVRLLSGQLDTIAGYEATMRRLGGQPQATAWYVDLLFRAGRVDRAEQVWKTVRGNRRVMSCAEGPLLDARLHLRRGELGPAERVLREAETVNGVVWVERWLLLAWTLAGSRKEESCREALQQARGGPYPLRSLATWQTLLDARLGNTAIQVESTAPGWRDFLLAQQARQKGDIHQARQLYRQASTIPAVSPFAQYGLVCLGEGDAGAVLAGNPGLFYAVRARARQICERFRAREIGADALLEGLQQVRHLGIEDAVFDHFRCLAMALQNRQPDATELAALVDREPPGAMRRNAIRIALEQVSERLSLAQTEPLVHSWVDSALASPDGTLRTALGRHLLRVALHQRATEPLDRAGELLPGEPIVDLVRVVLKGESDVPGLEGIPAGRLWHAARQLEIDDRRQQLMEVRETVAYRPLAQALLCVEAARREDVPAVMDLLEDLPSWQGRWQRPPDFVLRLLEALAMRRPAHPGWQSTFPRWLAAWQISPHLPTSSPVAAPYHLHQAAKALLRQDAVAAVGFVQRALMDDIDPATEEVVRQALPRLQRRADAQALARCLGTDTPAVYLTDMIDLLRELPTGEVVLEAARRNESSRVQQGLAELCGQPGLSARLYHHLALVQMRWAQREEARDSLAACECWRRAWDCWLVRLPTVATQSRTRLLEYLLGLHRQRINDHLSRDELEAGQRLWSLVQSLPGRAEQLAPDLVDELISLVNRFRDELATEYLLTTREAMRLGDIPEGWRADYERGLALLGRLVSLDHDNIRLLTALIETCDDWLLDLYHNQDGPGLAAVVDRFTPLATQLARRVESQPGEGAARSALSDFWKFRGFIEPVRAHKIELYREALRLHPGNANVRELLAELGEEHA